MEMAWYIPLLIFFARILDVPIGTIRMIVVINGQKFLAALLGFFEVIIWALAVGGVISFLTNPFALVAYGAGFAVGTLIGMTVESRIALGYRVVRVINSRPEIDVSTVMRGAGYKVTRIEGSGMKGPVEVAFLAIPRRKLQKTLEMVRGVAPEAFVSVERADRAAAAAETPSGRIAVSSFGKFGGVRK
ncbi:MAG: DUF2179 domain-containing protein [Phycisphaerales bacterium]|nr:MAG: DUF2179 domain-containing protein [Phycisphaerales bacterium]